MKYIISESQYNRLVKESSSMSYYLDELSEYKNKITWEMKMYNQFSIEDKESEISYVDSEVNRILSLAKTDSNLSDDEINQIINYGEMIKSLYKSKLRK